MLKVRKETRTQNRRNLDNYNTRERYGNIDNYYSNFDYETIDLNDSYDYDTMYDVDFAYDEYNAFDREPRYVEPVQEPRYSSFREYSKEDGKLRSERKKRKMSKGMKALVVVYFAIVAVIATLLIINALPVMSGVPSELSVEGMENIERVEVDPSTINNVTMADGVIVTMAKSEKVPYEYTENSNWFDNMCDWMENLVA